MSDAKASYRRILKSSSIIGGASFLNIAIGVLRTKFLAVLLGPAGVGLMSLYAGVMTTAANFAAMGVGTIGTRQVAEAFGKEDGRILNVVRRAMLWGTVLLACAGALIVWLLRRPIAVHALGGAAYSSAVGWLSLGVALSVAGASQGALIQGMRRIGDLAKVTVLGSLLATVLGVAMLYRWRNAALVAFVIVGPAAAFAVGHYYVSRLPKTGSERFTLKEIWSEWGTLLRLGLAFVAATLIGSLFQLWIRIDIGKVLGDSSVGQYQAAWTISTQYLMFILGAMAADYYPRLTSVIDDPKAATRLINEQTEVAMLLSAPVFMTMLALAPWVIRLLYSTSFTPAIAILRWQVLGDVLKVASWPLGFVILAAGDGKTFLWTESASYFVMSALITGLLPVVGLPITGVASLACYALYLPVVYWLARRRIGFRWSRSVFQSILFTFATCAAIGIVAVTSKWGVLIGCGGAAVYAVYALKRVSHMSDLGGGGLALVGTIARRLSLR